MIPTPHNPSPFTTCFRNAFDVYRSDMLAIHAKISNDEGINETSSKIKLIQQYQAAYMLGALIKVELDKGVNIDWTYYINKYNLSVLSSRLTCNGISLSKILGAYGLPTQVNENFITSTEYDPAAIGVAIVQDTLIIEGGEDEENLLTNITEYLENPYYCNNYVTNEIVLEDSTPLGTPGSITNITVIDFIIYYGFSANPALTGLQIASLTNETIDDLDEKVVTCGATGYKYVAIPVINDVVTSFVDDLTDIEIDMEASYSASINGILCNVYRTTNILGASIDIRITI